MNSTPALEVQNISKTYATVQAVDNLSFTVNPGEIFGLLGPNGAGKTTSIRMILDIIKPDHGQISVLGGPMSEDTKSRIGYLILLVLTGLGTIWLMARLFRVQTLLSGEALSVRQLLATLQGNP